jgi:RND family efflux transporter MFP subunit
MDRTQLQQAKINMINLEADFKRLDTLKKTKSIADQQYDQLKARYDIAKSNYEFLLENTQLKAPFSGIISGKYFEDGEMYSGSPVSSIGKPAVVSLIQINNLTAQVSISSSYFPSVKLGMKADVVSELYPDKTFKGEVYRIYPTVDNATKTFMVEIKVQNSDLKLRPGMFAKLRLNFGEGAAVLVPSIAIIKQTGTNNMYTFVNQNNKAVKKQVKTGRIVDDKTEILDGISVGEELIVVGQNKLEDKVAIKIIK